MMATPATHQSTTRFSSRVADYVKARPTYPARVIDLLRQQIGFDTTKVVADIGAGTGISSELFLSAGNRVIAVEPNGPMRDAAKSRLSGNPNYLAIDATAEATSLEPASVDLIVAAQAFHWFDRASFAAESRRIGKPGSHLLLMWNERLATGSPFAEAYEQLLLDVSGDYTKVDHRQLSRAQIAEVFGAPPEVIELPNAQVLDYDLLAARAASSSYVPAPSDSQYGPFFAELRRIFDRTQSGGAVRMKYCTQLHLGPIFSPASRRAESDEP